jgi:2-amino-4-hydroxy-6-hydroxymethyldihydropteridine diphosphokinase
MGRVSPDGPQGKALLVAFGANLPFGGMAPEAMIPQAAHAVARGRPCRNPHGVSRFYRTPAFPAGAGPDYVNAAAVW